MVKPLNVINNKTNDRNEKKKFLYTLSNKSKLIKEKYWTNEIKIKMKLHIIIQKDDDYIEAFIENSSIMTLLNNKKISLLCLH